MDGIKNLNLNVNVTVFAQDDRYPEKVIRKIFRGIMHSENVDQSLVINLTDNEGAELLVAGRPIFLFLAHDLGLYVFSAIIKNKTFTDGKFTVECSKSRQVRCFQRRQSVRVNVNIPAGFSLAADRTNVQYGFVTDLSLGGMQLRSPLSFPVRSDLELVFQLDKSVYINGEVVRAVEKNGEYYCGIRFSNPDEQTKDDIARFIIAEQIRQKRLGLQMFKAFIFDANVKVQAPTVFSITKYKNLDISALQGKKCSGIITDVGIHDINIECPLTLPVNAELEFSVDLPKLGYFIIKAVVRQVARHQGIYLIRAEFVADYEKIRDGILAQMAKGFNLPQL